MTTNMEIEEISKSDDKERLFSTFWIADRLYGIDVMKVQEVTKPLSITRVPLSPQFVIGLINLRGQISTAISLRTLFEMEKISNSDQQMNVVCRVNDLLLSFMVDKIGDVIEVAWKDFEEPPDTVPENIREFMKGVYKIPGSLLSIIDVDRVAAFISAGSMENKNSKQ